MLSQGTINSISRSTETEDDCFKKTIFFCIGFFPFFDKKDCSFTLCPFFTMSIVGDGKEGTKAHYS
jgi:Zn-finger protein